MLSLKDCDVVKELVRCSDSLPLSHLAELTASHFGGGGGGGLLRKKAPGEQQEEGNQKAKSRQELIEELIQKSKQEKVSQ